MTNALNRSGFSLLLSMVAVAISGLVVVGVMQVIKMGSSGLQTIAERNELNQFVQRMSLFMSNPTACAEYFAGRTFDSTAAGLLNETVPNPTDPDPLVIHVPGDTSRVLATDGMALGNRGSLSAVQLKDFIANGTDRYVVNLQFTAKYADQQVLVRTLPLDVLTSDVSAPRVEITQCQGAGFNRQTAGDPGEGSGVSQVIFDGDPAEDMHNNSSPSSFVWNEVDISHIVGKRTAFIIVRYVPRNAGLHWAYYSMAIAPGGTSGNMGLLGTATASGWGSSAGQARVGHFVILTSMTDDQGRLSFLPFHKYTGLKLELIGWMAMGS